MNFANRICRRIDRAGRAVLKHLHTDNPMGAVAASLEQEVIAVCNCYPTRIVLYAAAFQGGWRVHFVKSLREALEAAKIRRPRAVLYDHHMGDAAWDRYCSLFSREGVPFVLLAHKEEDETFLVVLTSGGYHASGSPLTSEDVVKAVNFAGDVAELARVEVP